MKADYRIILFSILFAIVYWVADSIFHVFYFGEHSFVSHLFFNLDPHELYMRLAAVGAILVLGSILSVVVARLRGVERDAKSARDTAQLILDSASFGVFTVGPDKRIRHANRAAYSTMGYASAEELVGRVCHENVCLECVGECPVFDKGQMMDRSERTLLTKNGTTVPILKSAVIVDLDGEDILVESFVDITERKTAQLEMEKLASVVRNSSELMNLATLDGDMIFLNAAGCELLGLDQASVENVNIMDVIPDHLKAKVRDEVVPAIISGEGWSGDLQYLNLKTGKLRDVHATTFPIRDPVTSKPLYLANVSMDIADRKRAEKAVRKSEGFLRAVFEGIQDGISILDRDLNIVKTNVWMERMYASEAPLPGKKCYRAYQHIDAPCKWCPSIIALKDGQKHTCVVPYPDEHAPKGWIELTAFPLKDDAGGVTGIVEHVKDITDRKRAEDNLRLSEERFRQIAENLNEFVWEVDTDGIYTYANPMIEEILGYSASDLVGKMHFYDLFVPAERDDLKRVAMDVFARKEPLREFLNLNSHKDGREVWLSTSGVPMIGDDGRLLGYRGADVDITERKRIEHIRANLVRDVSHSLKTPIATMQMALEMCTAGVEKGDLTPVQDAHDILDRNIRMLGADVAKILKMYEVGSRIAQRKEGEGIKTNVAAVVKQAAERFRDLMAEKGLSIEVDLHEGLRPVAIDEADLDLVVTNLIENAVKFTDEGGVRIEVRPDANFVQITVVDTGCGIDAKDLPSVFDTFYQRNPAVLGVGLGLSICKELVGFYGGQLTLESEGAGKGARVTARLPSAGQVGGVNG